MSIPKRWSRIDPKVLRQIPDMPGAYEIADRRKKVIDIGSSENLAQRIPSKVRDPKFSGQARYFRFVEDDDSEIAEAELQADFMAKFGYKPRYTKRVQGEAYELLDDW